MILFKLSKQSQLGGKAGAGNAHGSHCVLGCDRNKHGRHKNIRRRGQRGFVYMDHGARKMVEQAVIHVAQTSTLNKNISL